MSNNVSLKTSCAVLVIHGVGEQKPGATIRGFVNSVLNSSKKPKFFSKPDHLSRTFELRKYQGRERPRTHFYEYYWAHQSSGTTFSHVLTWLLNLLLRMPSKIPKAMLGLYILLWISVGFFALALVSGVMESYTKLGDSYPLWLVSLISVLLGVVLNVIVLGFLGDAARYLSPTPKNVKMRHAIRSEGADLLQKLHDKGYGRIIIVGHSLGSVIAYDMIRQVWDQLNHEFSREKAHDQTALKKVEELGEKLRSESLAGNDTSDLIEDYRSAQRLLSLEMQELKMGWRVTDFITAGSPLAHAALLMADGEEDLRARQSERELPVCPPDPDVKTFKTKPDERSYSYQFFDPDAGEGKRLRTMHGAAPFAFTRWTNFYFPAKYGLFGDFIGGQMRPAFGPGIKDVAVSTKWLSGIGKLTPLAHTRYWSEPKNRDANEETALRELIAALDLGWDEFIPEKNTTTES